VARHRAGVLAAFRRQKCQSFVLEPLDEGTARRRRGRGAAGGTGTRSCTGRRSATSCGPPTRSSPGSGRRCREGHS
jgi:hypothetical protein